jgi:hypothetical protein
MRVRDRTATAEAARTKEFSPSHGCILQNHSSTACVGERNDGCRDDCCRGVAQVSPRVHGLPIAVRLILCCSGQVLRGSCKGSASLWWVFVQHRPQRKSPDRVRVCMQGAAGAARDKERHQHHQVARSVGERVTCQRLRSARRAATPEPVVNKLFELHYNRPGYMQPVLEVAASPPGVKRQVRRRRQRRRSGGGIRRCGVARRSSQPKRR